MKESIRHLKVSGKSFYLLLLGETISSLGNQVTLIAIPLVAIYDLHANNFMIGILNALYFLPYLILGLHAGAYVDRFSKRNVMLACDFFRAIFLLLVPTSYLFGELSFWILFAVALANGSCTVFFEVSYVSYLPEILSPELLQHGNSRIQLAKSAAQFGGPSLGGYLIQVVGASVAVAFDAASYFLSFLSLMFLPRGITSCSNQEKKSLWADIKEGLIFVVGNAMLRMTFISYSLSVLFIGSYQALSIIYMSRVLYLSAATIGLVLAIGNGGFLVGTIISKRLADKIGIGWTIVLGLALIPVGFIWNGLATTSVSLPWLIFGQFILSVGVPIYNVNLISLRQAITPKSLLARVSSVSRVFGRGMVPFGAVIGAALATWTGLRFTIIVSGVGGLLALLPVVLSPVIGVRDIGSIRSEQSKLP